MRCITSVEKSLIIIIGSIAFSSSPWMVADSMRRFVVSTART
jgi:hypothetical protein